MLSPKYKRVLLKLSGEAFGHGGKFGISQDETAAIAEQLVRVHQAGVQLAVVVGGGNILRGKVFSGAGDTIRPATADYMGMLATIINGLALQDTLEKYGAETRLTSAVRVDTVCEPYIRRRAIRHLEKGRIVILAGGTGNPFVTTDTAAALRGMELEVEVVLKATKVDGVYSANPDKYPNAERYERLSFEEAIRKKVEVMDVSAFDHCQRGNLPIIVFNYQMDNAIERVIAGQPIGTIVGGR